MRLFFAIWPSQAAAQELRELSARIAGETGGRATPADNIHLTLEFLGEVAEERIEELARIAASARVKPFLLRFDRLGAFRRARIAWAGTANPPAALLGLQRSLNESLRAAGFALEDRPYAAHVTLARHTQRPPAQRPIEPIEWRVGEFALVRSQAGKAKYTDLARWRLG